MLPPEKVHKTVRALNVAIEDELDWVSEDHIDHLYGLLQHCSSVLVKGNFHLPFSTTAYKQAKIHKYAMMHDAWKSELVWWRTLLTAWNCVAFILPMYMVIPKTWGLLSPFTDACRSLQKLTGGAGAVFGHRFQFFKFTEEEITWLTIMDLEALTLILWLHTLCMVCPKLISGKHFLSWCDNDNVVKAVQANKSNRPTLAFTIEILHDLQCRFSFDLELQWVDTKSNRLADALSRNEIREFMNEMSILGFDTDTLVFIPIQDKKRSEWSSTMKHCRQTEAVLLQKQDPPTDPE